MRPTSRPGKIRLWAIAVSLLLVLVLATCVTGCGQQAPEVTTSTSSVSTSTSTGETTTSLESPVQLSDTEKDLAKTSRTQNDLTRLLREENAPTDDPRMAIVYDLHARAQALGCLQLIDKDDSSSLDTADAVMLDIYHLLNLARNVATGAVADTTASARAIADKIGAPSDHVDEAKELLQQFIDATAPLVDEAAALVPSTTTT